MSKNKSKYFYIIIVIVVLFFSVIGSTYAYLTASVNSVNSIKTSSSSYSLSMNIIPVYNDFRFIPMDDVDVMKALKNGCKDKYNRGACSAYRINVFDYDVKLKSVYGKMDVELSNMINLSYMFFEEVDEAVDEDKCVNIDDRVFCMSWEATPVLEGKDLSFGNYDVGETTEKNFLLVLWLTNLNESQNSYDLGDFNATVTFSMGDGGSITGNIAASIGSVNELQSGIDNELQNKNDEDNLDDNGDGTTQGQGGN